MSFSIPTIKKIAIASLTTSVLAVTFLVPQVSSAESPVSDDVATTFKTKCASCHGLDGSGNTAAGKKLNARDLRSAEVKKMSDAQMITIIAKGKGKMPAAKNLNADQIKEQVAYIRSLQK
jgi:cytochrome c6